MSRSKSHSREEYYKGEIRRLKKLLRKYEKMESQLQEHLEDVENDEPIIKDSPKKSEKCPACEDGKLKLLDLGIKVFEVCDSCSYRKEINKDT